jgi:hypothetical protein
MTAARPFVCNMNALSSDQRSRHAELAKQLRSALLGIRELSSGYDFEFPLDPDIYFALTQITLLEHACCPFFTLAIRLEDTKLFGSSPAAKA